MKKELKCFGIIAVFALIVFSAAACKGTDGLTYTVVLMTVDQDHYEGIFGDLFEDPQEFKLLEGSRGELIDKVNLAINNGNFTLGKNVSGLSYDTAKDTIYAGGEPKNGLLYEDNVFVVNELRSREYCVGVRNIGDGIIGIAAAYSE